MLKITRVFDLVAHHVSKDADRLTKRLTRNLKATESGCIEWTGKAQTNGGYPTINFFWDGKHTQLYVHHLFMVLKLKRPLQDDEEVDHQCNNRRCVAHLNVTDRQGNCRAIYERRRNGIRR